MYPLQLLNNPGVEVCMRVVLAKSSRPTITNEPSSRRKAAKVRRLEGAGGGVERKKPV